ncbi:MAG: ankyrin repeat domain-containing protein, partial [Sphingomonadaceae bacterium]
DYAKIIDSKRLSAEFAAADAKRDGSEQQDYGPDF